MAESFLMSDAKAQTRKVREQQTNKQINNSTRLYHIQTAKTQRQRKNLDRISKTKILHRSKDKKYINFSETMQSRMEWN